MPVYLVMKCADIEEGLVSRSTKESGDCSGASARSKDHRCMFTICILYVIRDTRARIDLLALACQKCVAFVLVKHVPSLQAGEESGSSPETSASSGGGSRPSSSRRLHRHSSSGNVMLDQLLKDLGNRLTFAEDVSVRSQQAGILYIHWDCCFTSPFMLNMNGEVKVVQYLC